MRDLTSEELSFVSGGSDDVEDVGGVVVVGNPYTPPPPPPPPPPSFSPPFVSPGDSYPHSPSPGYGGGNTNPGPSPADTSFAGQHLHLNVANPSLELQNSYNHLHDRLNNDAAAVKLLPDNAVMRISLSDGTVRSVTGSEIKSIFANLQISVDAGGYHNGTNRGASTDDNGVTHFGQDTLTSYIRSTDSQAYQNRAADYLLFHEIGHNTNAGILENAYDNSHFVKDQNQAFSANEYLANTIAHGVESYINLQTLNNASYGYDVGNVGFQTPNTSSGGGGGGGGGRGNGHTQIP